MQTEQINRPLPEIETDALVIPAFEDKQVPGFSHEWIEEIYRTGEFKGKAADIAILHRPQGLKARKLVAAGGGRMDKYDAAEMRKLSGAAVRKLKTMGVKHVTVLASDARMAEAAVEGGLLGDYEPDQYKTDEAEKARLDRLSVAGTGDFTEAVRRGRIIAESQNLTRDLVNEPANRMTPMILAERARAMAKEQGLECEVLDRERMQQIGMGSLLGVAQGSAEPPTLIVLRYRPAAAAKSGLHLGLVGKGVTFDTGGISIKPADGMEKMKYDMAGGAAVIGAMQALAQLKPSIPITAFVPAVENMPGSRAQRPGDIVKTLNGKTVEVLNTDAEGRLILIDAIEYAKRAGCTHLVDAATLTGSIVIALGHVNVGLFANNDDFRDRLMRSASSQGEKMWPMPIDEEYKEALKSAFADLPNIGTRWGGSITAALFLKEFADPTPWVHLDIAGTAWLDEAKPHLAKGPSGVCVRTFVDLAMNWRD
jgi:leucyl aminopeptidase